MAAKLELPTCGSTTFSSRSGPVATSSTSQPGRCKARMGAWREPARDLGTGQPGGTDPHGAERKPSPVYYFWPVPLQICVRLCSNGGRAECGRAGHGDSRTLSWQVAGKTWHAAGGTRG